MLPGTPRIGILLDDWRLLDNPTSRDKLTAHLTATLPADARLLIISRRDLTFNIQKKGNLVWPAATLIDIRCLAGRRMKRVIDTLYYWDRTSLSRVPLPPIPKPRQAGLLLIADNGTGLGHVTRLQLVADALRHRIPISFLSFSAAITQHANYPCLHIPSAKYLNLNSKDGNFYHQQLIQHHLRRHPTSHVIFDGNIIPDGLLMALGNRPEIHFTWLRRGMWRSSYDHAYLILQAVADVVMQPGDLAESEDKGASWHGRFAFFPPRQFLATAPILSRHTLVPRAAARAALGLDESQQYALVMPGFDKSDQASQRQIMIADMLRAKGFIPIAALSPLLPDPAGSYQRLHHWPIQPYFNGFDLILSAAGYNSFHEILSCNVPAIFLPNEEPDRDDQSARALWAAKAGLANYCRPSSLSDLPTLLNQLAPRQAVTIPPPDWQEIASRLDLPQAATKPLKPPRQRFYQRSYWRDICRRHAGRPSQKKILLLLAKDWHNQDAAMAQIQSYDPANSLLLTDCVPPARLRQLGWRYLRCDMAHYPNRASQLRLLALAQRLLPDAQLIHLR